jgi:hypothetical protein
MAIQVNANALADLASTKAYLKIPTATTTDDDLITSLINACSTAIENYCRRTFSQITYTDEMYDGNNSRYLNLKNYPVISVSSVKVNGVLIDSSQYVCKKDSGVLARVGPYPNTFTGLSMSRFQTVWNRGDWNIAVTYSAGFTAIPDDVALALKMYVASIYKADVANFSTTFNDGFVFKADSMPVQTKLLLQPYVDTSKGVQ